MTSELNRKPIRRTFVLVKPLQVIVPILYNKPLQVIVVPIFLTNVTNQSGHITDKGDVRLAKHKAISTKQTPISMAFARIYEVLLSDLEIGARPV